MIEKYKSGFTPPGDPPFADLSNGHSIGGQGGGGGGGDGSDTASVNGSTSSIQQLPGSAEKRTILVRTTSIS